MVSVAVFAMLMLIGDWSFLQAAFTGGLALVVLGFLLSQFICTESTAKADLEAVQRGERGLGAGVTPAAAASAAAATNVAAPSADATAADTKAASAGAGSVAASAAAPVASAVQPSANLTGQADLAGRKGEWKYEGDTKAAPAAKQPAAKKPVAKKAAPKKAAAAPAPAPMADDAPAAPESKPETLTAARGGQADDLKLIGGVGPKLEGTLNELGFYHFDQVAAWTTSEVSWVDSRLRFKGRIARDNWIDQAKILASGGETEFSKKKKK